MVHEEHRVEGTIRCEKKNKTTNHRSYPAEEIFLCWIMANAEYCLRWNNHLPNIISVFSSLLTNECLVDVTLAAEGKYLQAHKVVLSACSSYFQVMSQIRAYLLVLLLRIYLKLIVNLQELFSANPCRHPIVVLKDVAFNDLKCVVDFIYFGEVNVSQERLHPIFKVSVRAWKTPAKSCRDDCSLYYNINTITCLIRERRV